MKPRRSSYKVTFLDRHGPAGMLRVKAMGYGAAVAGLSFPMFVALYDNMMKFGGVKLLIMVAGSSLLLGYIAMAFGLRMGDAAGDGAQYLTAGGSSTPYEEAFSHEQSLIMQRDYAGAAACFEHRIKMAGELPDVRAVIAGADVYRDYKLDPKRSVELYKMAQKLPTLTPGQDVYVANKLADLYIGPLQQPGKALVEFRRLIERYPNSRTADHARLALNNVKQGMADES
jgi:hypothetical protein